MKRALIPAMFVFCSAFASVAWRMVELPCQVSKLEIASAVASPLLRCAVNELSTHEVVFSEVNRRGQAAASKINSVGVSISAWLVRHRV
jgi:hypothetical protein